jgi:hypothetical protein
MNDQSRPEEHRMYPRMPAEFSCVIRRIMPDGTEAPLQMVKTRNIGLGGMLIETEIMFAPGDAMRMVVMIGQRRIEARAKVVFAGGGRSGTFQYGVEFTDILEENRDFLLAYYLQKEYKLGS